MSKNNNIMEFKQKKFNRFNYKDILILLGLWYLFLAVIIIINNYNIISHTVTLKGLFDYSFLLAGRFLYFAIALFYLISIHDYSLKQIGLNFSNLRQQISSALYLNFILLIIVLFLINLPLSFGLNSTNFKPLFQINSPTNFIQSLIPLIFFYLTNIFIALAEIFLLAKIIFTYLKMALGIFPALLLGAISYNLLLLELNPILFIFNSILGFIFLYLYLKSESLILPTFFGAAYYTYYMLYIYGWQHPLP